MLDYFINGFLKEAGSYQDIQDEKSDNIKDNEDEREVPEAAKSGSKEELLRNLQAKGEIRKYLYINKNKSIKPDIWKEHKKKMANAAYWATMANKEKLAKNINKSKKNEEGDTPSRT